MFDSYAVSHSQIDAIEAAPSPEYLLRGIDIHYGKTATEGAREATGLHDAAYGEALAAFHGVELDLAVNGQPVFLSKIRRDDERVRLCEEDERIVDDAFLAA